MRKILKSCFVLGFWLIFSAVGLCWPWDKKAAQPAATKAPEVQRAVVVDSTPQEVKEAPKASKASMNKEKLLREKKKSALNNSQWNIEVVALSGRGHKQKDVLIFQDDKFSSQDSLKQGFKESNYTLTLLENDMVVVETMQSAQKGGIIFWRVEFDPEVTVCKGVLSRQMANTKTEDYSFVSISKKATIPEEVIK